MARHEADREDLLGEARALVERAEWRLAGEPLPVVVGFRSGGEPSFYFGPDAAYHFNAAGELRRAFVGGLLYKAERGRLVGLARARSETETSLLRQEPGPEAQRDLLAALAAALDRLRRALAEHAFQEVGRVPPEADVAGRMLAWLAARQGPLRIASQPGLRASLSPNTISRDQTNPGERGA